MVAKTERTITKMGTSEAITLPRHWLDGMELKAGDVVEVLYDETVTIRKRTENQK
jgi:antitoxin component of MazEF toxin-antitoxin module